MSENPVLARMAAHRSVRRFAPTPVPAATIEAAVRAAEQAATSSWIQAYSLLQVTDVDERARLSELTGGQPQVAQAGAFFCVCADVRRQRLVARRAGAPYHANLETFLLAVIDASLFAQNLTLAFESMGLGCCYIGGLRNDLRGVDALLELPQDVWALFGLCVGEPAADEGAEQRPRFDPRSIWSVGRHPTDDELLQQTDTFDEVAAQHYAQRGLPGRNWSGALWRKFKAPLREELLAYYTAKGARLE